MSLLTHVINVTKDIASHVNFAFVLIETIFHSLSSLGAILVQLTIFIFSGSLQCLLRMFDGIVILLRDFMLFIEDVHQLFDETFNATSKSINLITQTTTHFYNSINRIFSVIVETLFYLILSTVLAIKQLIILIGDSTLLILQLVPLSLVSIVSWIHQNVVCMLQCLKSCAIRISVGVETFCSSICGELTGIPLSSVVGLILALMIGVLLRRTMKSFSFLSRLRRVKDSLIDWCVCKWEAAKTIRSSSSSYGDTPSSETKNRSHLSKSALLKELEKEREDKLCVICQDRFKCFILLPCRHFCLCQICMQILAESNPVCPICRHYVYDNLKIYNWPNSKYIILFHNVDPCYVQDFLVTLMWIPRNVFERI